MKTAFLLLATAAASAVAYGLDTARIALPGDLATQAERMALSGFGGRNKGSFELEGFHGEFTRGESRLALLNSAYVSNRGKSSFTLRDGASSELISAQCEMSKKTVTIDIVTFDPKKMVYQCDFRRDGTLLGARLVIGHPKASGFKAKFLAMDTRRGEAHILDNHLLIDSLHAYQGTKLQSSAPVGYQLTHNNRAIAALELTDVNPTLYLVPDATDDLRRSVLATALALAVLRDPADSALEE